MEQFIKLSAADKAAFELNGYVIVKFLYTNNEIDLLMQAAENDEVIRRNTYGRKDKDGNTTKLALWYTLGDNIYSLFNGKGRTWHNGRSEGR